MKVREKGVRRGGRKGNLFGQTVEDIDSLDRLNEEWRTEDRCFNAVGEMIASNDPERHHWSGVGMAVVFDPAFPFIRAMVKTESGYQRQPMVHSVLAIPAGRDVAYFGHNKRATVLARRHYLTVFDGRICLQSILGLTPEGTYNTSDEAFWDLSKPPTSIPRNAVMVKERAAYVSAPFSGHYAVVLREDLGKFFATIKDPHTGLTCVVAEIPYDLLDKALTESEPHNDGAPVAVGDKLIEFEGVQTFMQLRDSTSRVTLESYLSRRPMMPRDVLNPEKHSFDLRIYTTLMNRLTSGLVDRLNLFNSLPRRSEGRPQGRRFVMWQDEYLSSPNAHPGDWLPEAYVFHERGADQSDDDYFVSILKKMNLSFKEELERQVHDYFGVPAPVDGEILSVTLRQPDVFGKQGYDVVFVGCDGHRRIYTLPWTASFPVRGLERGPKLGPIKARELMAYALTFGSTRIQTMRNEEHLLPLCDGNKDLATTLLYRLGLLLVQCRCEPAFCEEISGGKPGLMLSARYLESKAGHLPNEQFIWWDMRPLLPYYRGDLGCAILPWIKLGSVGHVWRTMAFTCNMCRLNFIPHIGNKVDEDLIGFPFDLIKAGHCRPRSGAPVYAVAKAS